MSQGTVSMDLMSNAVANGAAAARAVDPNVSGHHSDEFAAHLRQADRADRDVEASGPTRGARDGGTPRRTDRTHDEATSDASAADFGAAAAPDATATTATGTAAATVATTAIVATAAEAAAAPLAAAAAAGRAVTGTAGTDALPSTLRAGAKAGTAIIGSATEGSTVGTVTTGDRKEAAGAKHAEVTGSAAAGAGPSEAVQPTQPTQPAQPNQNAGDPSVLGAATGAANPAGVVPSGPSTPAAQIRFDPAASGVTATASSTASSAPAPTTTAPQTSVAGQLAAALRTLPGKGEGVHVMTVRLHPDELGPVRVIARLTGNDVHLRVTTSTVAAAAAVSEATPRLHDALAGTGLTTTGLSVDHDADLLGGQSSGQPGGQHATGASVDGGTAGQSGANRSGHGTNSSGHSGQVTVDTPPQPHAVRHPSSRSLDLHV